MPCSELHEDTSDDMSNAPSYPEYTAKRAEREIKVGLVTRPADGFEAAAAAAATAATAAAGDGAVGCGGAAA